MPSKSSKICEQAVDTLGTKFKTARLHIYPCDAVYVPPSVMENMDKGLNGITRSALYPSGHWK